MRRLTHMLVAGLVLSCAVFAAPAQGLNQADLEEILGPLAVFRHATQSLAHTNLGIRAELAIERHVEP